ncbi:hypothetical protein BDR26DRAFT_858106 [Obelidium mucronatum]|nr:hypothetical protein BDR26DRAFT_858106 [Obelidium mucronatum]
MYLYESVFSGTVAGYVYSTILPVDKNVPVGGNHLGPQIRDFEAVVNEGESNVGICPLTDEQRSFVEAKFKENPRILLDIYFEYKHFGYPMTNILGVVASASDGLYEDLRKFNQFTASILPGVQVVPEFGNNVYYAKENKVSLLKHGNKIATGFNPTKAQKLLKSVALTDEWVKMPPSGGVPPDAESVGQDMDGERLFVARVKIGSAYYLGKIGETWKFPYVTYFNREVPIRFGHEVLKSVKGMKWEDAENGRVPLTAVKAGMEEDGTYLHIARGIVGGVGKKEGCLTPGMVAAHLKGAKIPYGGKEVTLSCYQVLCYGS